MKESDLDPDNFIKPLEDEVSHEIVLKLDDQKWINFYKKMKNHQFPKEITAFEITAIDTVFIQNLRK